MSSQESHTRSVFSSSIDIVRGQGELWHFSRVLPARNVGICGSLLIEPEAFLQHIQSSVLCFGSLLIFAHQSNRRNSFWWNCNYSFYKNISTWMCKCFLSHQTPFGVLCLLTHGLLVSLILWRQLVDKCPENLPYVVKCILLPSVRVLDGSGVGCVVLDLGWATQLVSESSQPSSIKS